MMQVIPWVDFSRKLTLAYTAFCKPLCKELELPQTAFDILMFLGNNPGSKTAGDIVEMRRIKPNLVSFHVERLVREGYLTRQAVAGDRRKTELFCTEKALPVIRRGQALQNAFAESLFADTDEATRAAFYEAIGIIERNLDRIRNDRKEEGRT